MTPVGQKERVTQRRVVALFRDALGYDYLGDWTDRAGNRNVESDDLRAFLTGTGRYDAAVVDRAVHALAKAAADTSGRLYDRNRAVYQLLRYGIPVKPDVGEQTVTVWPIDWAHPERNHFAVAEEVSVAAANPAAHAKRPDVVVYVNGVALAVLELKRASVAVAEGIRQNLDNQQKTFIEPFFSTVQWVLAGNDTEGLRYGTIETPEKHYLAWKEQGAAPNDGAKEIPLDRALRQLFDKPRFLELVHDFVAFDRGSKKLCRPNQYFGVRAAQDHVRRREGGILWHTQGSGKSLTMVWLARWIREHVRDARVLLVTDRRELDEQIEKVFKGVGETIYRTKSGADLIRVLNAAEPALVCSLVHKFGGREDGAEVGDVDAYVRELRSALPPGFRAKGDLFVFVDECHRTQSGELHEAMKAILPGAMFIGFTGTPLLRADRRRSIEVFGPYIHTYRFDEAVRDKVVLDLRYEARDVDQTLTSAAKVDQWFEVKTKALTPLARAQLKQRWGTLRKVLSSQSRLERIVDDILIDMETRNRLASGSGNAMLVSGSIYQACKYYELFAKTDLAGRCAIVTSYRPAVSDIKGESSGEGATERLRQYEIYRGMLASWFHEPPEQAVERAELFETQVKAKFVDEPGQMKLLIVVDKLLTGFDAPSATYLYIDKQMRDHGLFQAICRVNRLDGDDKEYGYVVDYKDLFKSLESAVHDYTSGALDGYDRADVEGLLKDRVAAGRQELDDALEAVRALCEFVEPPRDTAAYVRYFCAEDSGDAAQLAANEPKRLALYKLTAALVRAFANVADDLDAAGVGAGEAARIRDEVWHYEQARAEVKIASGDAIDLKQYEPAMRHLIDSYIRADDSRVVSTFDDLPLVQLIVERGPAAVDALPDGIRKSREAMAETIENNVRRRIVDEQPINPRYYEKMSELLDALIAQRRQDALDYAEYLRRIADLAKQVVAPPASAYPAGVDTPGRRALYDNLGEDAALALAVDAAVRGGRQDDWRNNRLKAKRVRNAVRAALAAAGAAAGAGAVRDRGPGYEGDADTAGALDVWADQVMALVTGQAEY